MSRTLQPPKYRLHKPTGQAVVTVRTPDGRRQDVYLGRHGTPESHAEYARVLRERPADRPTAARPPAHTATVNELLAAFREHAVSFYVKNGRPTTEVREYGYAARLVRQLYGHRPAGEFDVLALDAVRRAMVAAGWCRTRVNKQVGRVKRMFRWAAARKLVPAGLLAELDTLDGLKAGRSAAAERAKVGPVPDAHVNAVLPYLRPPARAMVRLQRLTGMRPGEVCGLRLADVDRSGPVWVYRPQEHKTEHHGRDRAVHIGPRGQAVIVEHLAGHLPAADEPVFSPARDRERRYAERRAKRKSKVTPSQQDRRKHRPVRVPGRAYLVSSYAHAVRAACRAAGVPAWHPHQLRHTHATEVRRQFGAEAAQAALGHANLRATEVYAEKDAALAARVAAAVG